jgi:hypothetical protein
MAGAGVRCVYALAVLFCIATILPPSRGLNSLPVLLESVTSFYTCIGDAGDPATDAQCALIGDNTSLTVIRALVSPERKAGPDGTTGNDLSFSRFPVVSAEHPVNSDPIDQTIPCASLDPGQNCDLFASGSGTDAQVSQFDMVFESSTFIRSYRLIPTHIDVPYAYLDYNADILGCDPDANHYLCTQLEQLVIEIGPICFVSPIPGSCVIKNIALLFVAFCEIETKTVGLDALSQTYQTYLFESWFGLGPYAPGDAADFITAGASPASVAAMSAQIILLDARVTAGENIPVNELANYNSVFFQTMLPIQADFCVQMQAPGGLCTNLPLSDDSQTICGLCKGITSPVTEFACGPWCQICQLFYGLPEAYCISGWDPGKDNTVCGASDARVFFGDWIQLMNPTLFNAPPGGEVGANPLLERSRNQQPIDSSQQCRGFQNDNLAALSGQPGSFFSTPNDFFVGGPCTGCAVDIIGMHEGGSGSVSKDPNTISQICPAGNQCPTQPQVGYNCLKGEFEEREGACPPTTNYKTFCYIYNTSDPVNQIGVGSSAQITAKGGTAGKEWCLQEQSSVCILPNKECFPNQNRAMCQNPFTTKSGSRFYGLWEEYADAYMCSFQPGGLYSILKGVEYCPLYACAETATKNAVSSMALQIAGTCTIDKGGTGEIAYEQWTRPGDRGLAVRPGRGTDDFYVARCSVGCQTSQTFPQRFKAFDLDFSTQSLKAFSQSVLLPDILLSNLKQRASLWVGGPQCTVYEITPEAYGEMEIQITLVFPDGRRERVVLDTADGPNIKTVTDVDSTGGGDFVPFTARINRINVPENAIGPSIVGLIVICGTTGANVFEESPAGAACDLKDGFQGQIRGRIPGGDISSKFLNPWPDIIQQAIETRAEAAQNGADPLNPAEEKQCPMPIPYYLGELNCGLPAYWYFVPFEDAVTYGPGCGQLGFRQIQDNSYATLLCQQGEGASCTPGTDSPLFGGITNGRQAKSPCIELGAMVNVTGSSRNFADGCTANTEGPKNMPPGFTWRVDFTDTYDQNREMGAETQPVAPNMWVDGSTLYVLERFYQGVVKADVSVYIQADLDAETITVTPGAIQANATYCGAALNAEALGALDTRIFNLSPTLSGSYLVSASCYSNIANQRLEVGPSTQQGPFNIGPGDFADVSFSIRASGPLVLGDAVCEIVLTSGAGVVMGDEIPEAGFTSKLVVSCDLFLPTLIQYAYQDFIAEASSRDNGPGCESWDLFCIISNEPWYIRYITYIVLGIIIIGIVILVISSLSFAITRASMLRAKGKIWKYGEHEQDAHFRDTRDTQ